MKKKNNSLLLSIPYIVWMLVFTLIPLGVVAYYALTDPETGNFTLQNIRDLGMFLPTLGKEYLFDISRRDDALHRIYQVPNLSRVTVRQRYGLSAAAAPVRT